MRNNSGAGSVTGRKTIPMLLCGLVLLAAAGARADTRDDVLSGIERCGVIHDDRTWLDCLYGAEQPMRAHLGLPPAPEFQQRLVPVRPGDAGFIDAGAHAVIPARPNFAARRNSARAAQESRLLDHSDWRRPARRGLAHGILSL